MAEVALSLMRDATCDACGESSQICYRTAGMALRKDSQSTTEGQYEKITTTWRDPRPFTYSICKNCIEERKHKFGRAAIVILCICSLFIIVSIIGLLLGLGSQIMWACLIVFPSAFALLALLGWPTDNYFICKKIIKNFQNEEASFVVAEGDTLPMFRGYLRAKYKGYNDFLSDEEYRSLKLKYRKF